MTDLSDTIKYPCKDCPHSNHCRDTGDTCKVFNAYSAPDTIRAKRWMDMDDSERVPNKVRLRNMAKRIKNTPERIRG